MRLDTFAASTWPELSRSTWKKRIEAGHVSVNGVVVMSPKYPVSEDDVVTSQPLEVASHTEMTLPILYEDDDVIVIDKPVGVLTHSKGELNDEFTVAEFVRPRTSYKRETNRPGIIHRLDRATSGVIICAKNDSAAHYLQRQFSQRTTKKTYAAVTTGIPKELEAVIELPIARNPSAPSAFRVDATGKHAETYYKVLEASAHRALLTLQPKTGRTHQLRVHLSYIGTPIVGDTVYGKESAERMYLHAASLEITLPGGVRSVFSSDIPKSFNLATRA